MIPTELIDRVKSSIETSQDTFTIIKKWLNEYQTDLIDCARTRRDLLEALKKYGKHHKDCRFRNFSTCACGFTEQLKGLAPRKTRVLGDTKL